MKIFWKGIIVFLFILSFSNCAQVVTPTGGPKDETAPQTLHYYPDSASTHFKSRSIIISFDEYIQLSDLQNQLIISPPLNKQPDIKIKNKDLLINFSEADTLKPNTTYVLNFGSAIRDNNEGNAKDGFKYIFSTGDYIDSLTVSGKVWNAFNHKTESGILVMLYKNTNDSVIYKSTPDYFTKTNADGSFIITNIHEGKYKIMALKDNNANYKYDSDNEKIAFSDSLAVAGKSSNLLLELFEDPPKKFYLKKYIYNSYGRVDFYFNKGSDSIKVKPLKYQFAEGDILLDYSDNKDSLTYWFRNIEKDSLLLEVSNGNKILDTLELKLITKEEALNDKKNPLQFKMLSSPDGNMNFDLGKDILLTTINPILTGFLLNSIKYQLLEDSMAYKLGPNSNFNFTVKPSYPTCIWINEKIFIPPSGDASSATILMPPYPVSIKLKPNTNYNLFIPPGSITDFFGLTNDSINIHFKTREEEYYGTLKLNVNVPETKDSYIIQLMDENETVIREDYVNQNKTIDYNYLHPTKYKVKIIQDDNKNNKWDNGNLSKKQQPEKVIYNNELINIRSNWDLELIWDVN